MVQVLQNVGMKQRRLSRLADVAVQLAPHGQTIGSLAQQSQKHNTC